jgi:hypothetical protein
MSNFLRGALTLPTTVTVSRLAHSGAICRPIGNGENESLGESRRAVHQSTSGRRKHVAKASRLWLHAWCRYRHRQAGGMFMRGEWEIEVNTNTVRAGLSDDCAQIGAPKSCSSFAAVLSAA